MIGYLFRVSRLVNCEGKGGIDVGRDVATVEEDSRVAAPPLLFGRARREEGRSVVAAEDVTVRSESEPLTLTLTWGADEERGAERS